MAEKQGGEKHFFLPAQGQDPDQSSLNTLLTETATFLAKLRSKETSYDILRLLVTLLMTHELGNSCEQSKKIDKLVDGIEEIYNVQKGERMKASVLHYSSKPLGSDLPVAAFSLLLVDTKEESRPHP